ncbi:MAG: glycosyltransferase family 9 protein [Thermodesulfobacteriota bacterium]
MKLRPMESIVYFILRVMARKDARDRTLKSLQKGSQKNILIVSSTAIGDTLMSTPAIGALRKCFPEARLIALFNKANMELFRDNPNIDGVVPYYGGWKKFISTILELKKYSFDTALILHGNEPQATPMAYLSGARFIVKLPNASKFNFLLSNSSPLLTWAELGHGIRARLQAAALLGCEADGLEMDLPLNKDAHEEAEIFLRQEGIKPEHTLIGLNPGASTLSRQWFPARFAELARRLTTARPDVRIILTGSPEEKGLCREIDRLMKEQGSGGGGEKAAIAAGRLSLNATAALIKKLHVFVTGDTGPMHMAYAQKTPVVALYAVSEPERTGPLTHKNLHRIIKKPRTCEPCISKKCVYQECMEQITVDEVFSALTDILEKHGAKKKHRQRK